MSIRDQILAADDFKSEPVDVPEWGVKLVMRELSVADRGRLVMNDIERVEVAGGFEFIPRHDPIALARIVVASAHEENGEKTFTDDDAELLAAKAYTVVHRLAQTARRLSGLDAEDTEDGEGKAPENGSSETPDGGSSSPSPTT
jgi:hypothetical protein